MGTATYFSPEQAEGIGVDARSDIYSLGVVLFEMVTGRPPFLGDTPVAVASKHVRDHPPAPRELNPSIPPTFEAIILKSMAKDPAHRYPSAEDLRADLLRFNEGRSVLAMNDTAALLAAAGVTQTIGAVGGMDATQAVASIDGADNVEDAEETSSNRTRTYAIILVILLALLALAGYLLARNLGYLGGSPSFNLPSVTGQPVDQATATLRGDGLVVKTSNEVSGQTPGLVLSTDPAGNSLVKKGDTVTLKVAVPAPVQQIPVPSGITNTTLGNAESILQGAGLQYTVVYKTSTVQKGTVLSANPASGSNISQGGSVALTVSSGPANVTVPSLIGLSQPQAGVLLGQAGLNVGNISSQASNQYAAGQIISSSPGTGASVSPGSSVDIVVSSGPPPSTTTTTTSTTTTSTTSPNSSSTTTSSSSPQLGNLRPPPRR
jgi:serine/threonine-protein kinase